MIYIKQIDCLSSQYFALFIVILLRGFTLKSKTAIVLPCFWAVYIRIRRQITWSQCILSCSQVWMNTCEQNTTERCENGTSNCSHTHWTICHSQCAYNYCKHNVGWNVIFFIIWQSQSGKSRTLWLVFSVGILQYGPFPQKRSKPCTFVMEQSWQIPNLLPKQRKKGILTFLTAKPLEKA